MDNTQFKFTSESKFEDMHDLPQNIFQILKYELGYYFTVKYEEAMDNFAIASSMKATTFYENFTSILRKTKNCLNDKKVQNLQQYILEQRTLMKDDFMTYKTKRNLTIVIDILDNINKSVIKLIYNILQEVKFGYLKKTKSPYLIIDDYFNLKVKKNYESLDEFIEDNYLNTEKVVKLAYGGI